MDSTCANSAAECNGVLPARFLALRSMLLRPRRALMTSPGLDWEIATWRAVSLSSVVLLLRPGFNLSRV